MENLNDLTDIWDVLGETKAGTKGRTRRLDERLFRLLTKTKIEKVRKSWRGLGLPSHIIRILNQAVSAYYRKEYAITVVVLVSLLEDILARFSGEEGRRSEKKACANFSLVVETNGLPGAYKEYFVNFVMYQCNKREDVIADVPGRHGCMHGWHIRYPSRKAALNAILLTDMLLQLTCEETKAA